MAYYRVCEKCGCTLDSGESNPCEECKEKEEKKYMQAKSNSKQYESLLNIQEDGQMVMGELIYV